MCDFLSGVITPHSPKMFPASQTKKSVIFVSFFFLFFLLHLVIFNYIFYRVMKDFGCRTPSALKLSDRLWATFSYYETTLFISEVRGFFFVFLAEADETGPGHSSIVPKQVSEGIRTRKRLRQWW